MENLRAISGIALQKVEAPEYESARLAYHRTFVFNQIIDGLNHPTLLSTGHVEIRFKYSNEIITSYSEMLVQVGREILDAIFPGSKLVYIRTDILHIVITIPQSELKNIVVTSPDRLLRRIKRAGFY